MFFNYIKITIRGLIKDKLHSIINILGLSIGLAVSILMFLYVSNEFSYDSFHKNAERIYQFNFIRYDPNGAEEGYFVHAPIPFGEALENDISEVEHAIRFAEEETFVRSDLLTAEENILLADREFFKTFTFPFTSGNPEMVLNTRYSCVITEEFSRKYFGNTDPTGKSIDVLLGEEFIPFTIDGIVTGIPSNSSLEFTILLPYDLLNIYEWFRSRQDSWNSWNSPTYVLLKENAGIESVEEKMVPFWEKYLGEEFAKRRASGEWKFDHQPLKARFIPLTKVHHNQLGYQGITKTSDPAYAYILAAIGLGILLLACINFMNLSISRASTRTKEVAVRRVIGAARRNLVYQFCGEAILVSIAAMLIATVIVVYALPQFNSVLNSNLSTQLFGNWQIISGILIITLMAGLFAGFYPGLFMSSLKPVQIFSRKIKFGGSNMFTKSLVVMQFALATFFILGTFIITSQLRFIQNKNLGFDKEQVVVIRGNYQKVNAERIMHLFKSKFANDPDIAGIAGVRYSFTRGYDNIAYEDNQGKKRILYTYRIDENFIDLMNIEVAEGRNFSKNFPTDSTNAVIVNESLVKSFGIEDPIGKPLGGFKNSGLDSPTIIGVVKDFHFESLKNSIEPAVMYINSTDNILYVYAKLKPDHIRSGLEKLQTEWNSIEPSIPFQYSFLDADLYNQYLDAQQRRVVINYSAGFAVFIAVIGLFGMVSYSSVRRKKEIGIRKILGASVRSIVKLINKEFAMLLIAANLLAWPAAYFSMENWLEDFAYRIEINWWFFILSGSIVLLIALATVSFQAIKAAMANPVESLRYE